MPIKYFTLDLKARAKTIGDVPEGEGIEFLAIDIAEDPTFFLAPVRFAVDGKDSELGLRIDLGKEVFLDDVYGDANNPQSFSEAQIKFLAQAAPMLAAMVNNQDLSL